MVYLQTKNPDSYRLLVKLKTISENVACMTDIVVCMTETVDCAKMLLYSVLFAKFDTIELKTII